MPKMGDGMEEGTLLEWLKNDGDHVKTGDVIGSIQTDKATLELESPASGVLTGILLEAGGTVPVGQPIAAILKAGESLPAGWGGKGGSAPAPTIEAKAAVSVEPEAVASAAVESNARVKASPLARKIAAEKGIDLSQIKGSGPGGRVVEKDLVGAPATGVAAPAAAKPAPAAPAPTLAPPTPIVATAADQLVPLNKIRQVTARKLSESKQQVPHFYVTVEVDVDRILALRKQFEAEGSGKVSINDFVVKACALALREMPVANSSYQGDKLLQYGAVNIGIAVALPDGLTLPVLKNVDQIPLRAVSAKVKELATKAKDNKLGLDELSGSTFSISNMGMFDVDNFIAIVNAPNAAIVAISSVRKKPVVNAAGEIVVSNRMNISGSFDHRVIDGAVGAKFMNVVRGYLENPTRLLV